MYVCIFTIEFKLITTVPIQHPRIHSNLPFSVFLIPFTDSKTPGSDFLQYIYLFN